MFATLALCGLLNVAEAHSAHPPRAPQKHHVHKSQHRHHARSAHVRVKRPTHVHHGTWLWTLGHWERENRHLH